MKPASESIWIRIQRLSDWLAALPWMIGVLLSFLSILHFGLPAWFPGRMTEDMNSSAPDYPLAFETLKMAWTFGVALAAIGFMELRGAAGRWLPLAILLTALALAQAWLWQSAHSKYVLLGGLIPFSDASVYTEYANTIVQGRQVGFALQDRPMFAALLASLLLFCGRNPQCALGLLLLLAGTSMCLAARSVRVWFGRAAAVVFQVVVWLYYARWIGTTMTEQLGLILGLLACPFLITGFMEKRRVIWLAGIVVLTMALCSRAGAFFVLPALLFITAGHFAVQGRFAWKFSAQSFGAVVVVMALSRVLAFCVFDADNFPRSNFDYTAYGVVFGTRWKTAFFKYGTHHDKIWAAISQHVRKSPFSVPRGMWRAWREFFQHSAGFRFAGSGYSELLQGVGILAFILACRRKLPASSLVVAMCLGIGASIPFAPPWDADTMRVYAATIPLHALIVGLGMSALFRFAARSFGKANIATECTPAGLTENEHGIKLAAASAALLTLLIFTLPITRYVFFPPDARYRNAMEIARRPGNVPAGSFLNLVADDVRGLRYPNVRVGDFRQGLTDLAADFPTEAAAMRSLPAGTSIISGGFTLGLMPTEKLRTAGSTATFKRVKVGFLSIDVDTDLSLPFEQSAAQH